jgi:tetratricopeptide (TPR) repeat protein
MKMSKLILCLNVLLLVGISSFAQQEKIDSLKKVLPSLVDTARIDCLLNLCTQYVFLEVSVGHLHQPYRDSILLLSNMAYDESKRLNHFNGMARSFISRAALKNHFLADYPAMEELARESLKWFALTGNKKLIEIAAWQVGFSLAMQDKLEEGLVYFQEAYDWAEKNGNINWMYMSIGPGYEYYRDRGEYEKAFETFKKEQELDLKFKGHIDTSTEKYILAELYRRIGDNAAALNYYREFVKRIDLKNDNIWYRISYPELFALNDKMDSALYYYNLIDTAQLSTHALNYFLLSFGEFNLLKHQYKSALSYLLRSLVFFRGGTDMNALLRTFMDISQSYAALRQDNEALAFGREALAISLQKRAIQYTRDAYQLLYEIYSRRNQRDSAFTYYQKYVTQKEKVANDQVKGKFAAYNYDQQIGLLSKEKQLQQQQLKQAAQQRTFLIVGIAGVLLLGIFLIRTIVLKRKNEANRRAIAENELLLQKVENEKTKAEMEQQATELEMQALRAQMNPHFIFNSLNSINRFILQNNKTQASEYLTKFSKLVRLILQNSQAAMITLESELESLELYLDLEALRFDYRFGYKISIPKDLDVEVLKVPPLIIQPFAENAIWHGLMHKEEKGQLLIEICEENEILFFRIADNGIGRKAASEMRSKSATKHKSVGLKITAERIALLHSSNGDGSVFTINDLVHEDGTAAGTEVIIKIPVRYN